MGKKQHKRNWEDELRKSFEMWNELKNNGGTDPGWSDGMNMNLIRNHILYYKDQLLKNQPENLPAIFFTETPPEVDSNYMANKEKICADAMELLRLISVNSDFLYIVSRKEELDGQKDEDSQLIGVIRAAASLEDAFLKKDYVVMRRILRSRSLELELHNCAEKMKKRPTIQRQLTWDDFMAS